jgi:hypothetical protein
MVLIALLDLLMMLLAKILLFNAKIVIAMFLLKVA